MIRLFAGLPVPEELAPGIEAIQCGVPGARWRTREHYHITLAFIGEVHEHVAEEIDSNLGRVRSAPFRLQLTAAGVFGGSQAEALWLGVKAPPDLEALHGRCKKACREAGVDIEARRYHPHVTIAYLRAGAETGPIQQFLGQHALFSCPAWTADRFYLYSSHLGRSASHYTIEAEYPLIG
jgi:RNA 2',3'-cyclic 3'-phosphodiesterase